MRRIALLLAGAALLGGCGSTAPDANAICKPYGGVISTDWHGNAVVCADHVARKLGR